MSELSEFRQGKDHFMGGEHDSPLTHEQAQSFQGLSYYDEEPALRFELDLERYEAEEIIEMQTSTGDAASYLRWGKVSFDVAGDSAQLTIYKDTDGDGYFLPFADGTSGDETYPAGRYLDLHVRPDGKLQVDFNYAYNPYCAYNERWSCPLTPFENRLRVPIRAGEKSFK
jgi:uncharacterized protein (DUF1684 family)